MSLIIYTKKNEDKEINYNPSFKLFLHTKMANTLLLKLLTLVCKIVWPDNDLILIECTLLALQIE